MPALVESFQPLLRAHTRLTDSLGDLGREAGREVYLVGGCVRDAILGRRVRDLDLAVPGDGLRLGEALANSLRSPFVPLDDADRTGRVVLRRRYTIDLSSFKGRTLDEDLRKRDFTVNAMAIRLSDFLDGRPSIIDPCHGAKDLAARRLKAVSRESFRDDPLRMLRAHRIAGQYHLRITPETVSWIKASKDGLRDVSGERLLYELALILGARCSADRVSAMIESGALGFLFPGCPDSAQPALIRSLERTDRYIARDVFSRDHGLYPHMPGYFAELAGGRSSLWVLRLASFLLYYMREDAREPGHAVVERTADRLKLSNRERQALHQFTFGAKWLLSEIASGIPDDDACCRILRAAKDETPGAALLALAHGPEAGPDAAGRAGPAVSRLLELYNRYRMVRAKGLLLNGRDVMEDLDLPEGPKIGRMLDRLGNMQVLRDIRTREEARKVLYQEPGTVAESARKDPSRGTGN